VGLTPRRLARRASLAVQERRRRHQLWSAMNAALQPPPHAAFASWGGDSVLVPPMRVDNPQFMHVGRRVLAHELSWLIAQQTDPGRIPRLVLSDDVLLQRFVKIVCTGEVVIGEGVIVSDHVYIADTLYRHDDPHRPIAEQGYADPLPVRIGAQTLLGYAAVVMPGVTIGEHCSIGAGAVVTEDVPDRSVAVGNPARVVRHFSEAAQQWVRPER
jgi:acetyltransferase-like isoleucine patch superfamily enzyme